VGVGISGRDPVDPGVGHVSKIYVEPFFWRLGIARSLYESCLVDLRSRGFERASLHVLAGNRRARRWYERLGWTETGRPITQVHGHVLELEYQRQL
jgi:ribosomal protein S18 acetylase RimI-like enzyme